jgi:Fur family iron response transcriptional regulator
MNKKSLKLSENNTLKGHVSRLRSSNLRPTKQRVMICKTLFGKKETFHFTIEKLKQIVEKNTKSKISLATIYNTVHAFQKNGYLKEISVKGNKTFYDTNSENHHHFYDEYNGDLIDIKNEDIALSKIPVAPKGKKINKIEVTISLDNNSHNQNK